MDEERIVDLKNKAISYLYHREHKGAILDKIYKDLNISPLPIPSLRSYLDEICIKGYISKTRISSNRTLYRITEDGRNFFNAGGNKKLVGEKPNQAEISGKETNTQSTSKKILFISFASENYDKVKHIITELENHSLLEPLIVANKRRPNEALSKLIKDGIESAYCIIPILSPESYRTQWINQEIGYAEGVRIPIKPIVEKSLLDRDDLKGFVNKQNQCPYTYTYRPRPYKSSENKTFMTCFKLLIGDLEKEILKKSSESNKDSSTFVSPRF